MDSVSPEVNNNPQPSIKLRSHIIDSFEGTTSNLAIGKVDLPDTQPRKWTFITRVLRLIIMLLVLLGVAYVFSNFKQGNYISFLAHASGNLIETEEKVSEFLKDKLNITAPKIFTYLPESSPDPTPQPVQESTPQSNPAPINTPASQGNSTNAISIPIDDHSKVQPAQPNRCNNPIQYKVGRIDPQFNISTDELLSDISRAVSIWNNAKNKQLFTHSHSGSLTVNLIFDDKQLLTNKLNQLNNQLDELNKTTQTKKTQYQQEKNSINQQATDVNRQISLWSTNCNSTSATFILKKSQIDSLVSDIKTDIFLWNQSGGMTPEVSASIEEKKASVEKMNDALNEEKASYNKNCTSLPDSLKVQQKSVDERLIALNALSAAINDHNSKYRSLANTINQTNDQLKSILESSSYAGRYDGSENSITVYTFKNKDLLIHILAHEFGHALGIPHNENKDSVMYKVSEKGHYTLSVDDKAALAVACP